MIAKMISIQKQKTRLNMIKLLKLQYQISNQQAKTHPIKDLKEMIQ